MKRKTKEEKKLTKLKWVAFGLGIIALGLFIYAYYPRELNKTNIPPQTDNNQIISIDINKNNFYAPPKSLDYK